MKTTTLLIIAIALMAVVLVLLIIVLVSGLKKKDIKAITGAVIDEQKQQTAGMAELVNSINETNQRYIRSLGDQLKERQDHNAQVQDKQFTGFVGVQKEMNENELEVISEMQKAMNTSLETIYKRMESLEASSKDSLDKIRDTVSDSMKDMREENSKKLDEIKGTVDEKLQTTLEKRISESFKTVSEQLEQVYRGLGEMKTLASDVGGLKKVLSGVKTRGILGEIQLGAILEEILSPEQYEVNVATIPGSKERVEFAVRLPGPDGNTVYLPIDSKFPGERYAQLAAAQEEGDRAKVDAAYQALETEIKKEAKDIRTKYVSVPYTTNFGVMFLPFEGLYSEVVNRGLLEVLQRDYSVNVAGPSTMAAFLNSLQMGFRTLAIQKKSAEVWTTLGEVKTEFDKFEDVMKKMQTHLNQTTKDLDSLMGTRTRAIQRKLRDVQALPMDEPAGFPELTLPEEADDEE